MYASVSLSLLHSFAFAQSEEREGNEFIGEIQLVEIPTSFIRASFM